MLGPPISLERYIPDRHSRPIPPNDKIQVGHCTRRIVLLAFSRSHFTVTFPRNAASDFCGKRNLARLVQALIARAQPSAASSREPPRAQTLHSRPVPETTNSESYRFSKFGPGLFAQPFCPTVRMPIAPRREPPRAQISTK